MELETPTDVIIFLLIIIIGGTVGAIVDVWREEKSKGKRGGTKSSQESSNPR